MDSQQNIISLKYGIASFIATYISGVVHPLQLLKTRFQSHDGKTNHENLVPKYQGIYQGLKKIHQAQGFKGLYKGFYISLLSQAFATGLFFWIYEVRKKSYENRGYETMNAVTYSSLEASFAATLLTQPLWVIRTRMLLNIKPNVREMENAYEKGLQIYRQNGLKGFLKGIQLSLLLSFSGVIQMYSYEGSKILYEQLKVPQTSFGEKNFVCGSISKLISVIITYPITTVRTRIQQDQYFHDKTKAKYAGIRDITKRLMSEEGLRGFYKGIIANMARGIPQRGIYFYCYEGLKKIFIENSSS